MLLSDGHFLTARAQRKPRAEPEPEGEPKTKSGSENPPYWEPESEWNLTGNSKPTPENWPEPGPRWDEAYETWQWAWELHVYLYATSFLVIGLYAGYYVIANVYDGLQGKYLCLSLNIMVALFGFTRAFSMFLDPYHQGNIIHNTAVMRVIWSISGPCLTASDCLMILALIETAKVSIAPPKLQKPSVNAAIISFHFILVITTDCVVSDYVEAKAMLMFCQLFFVTWGSVLGTANFFLAYKLDKQLFSHKNPKEKADKIYISLIYASGAANVLLCGIILYSAFGVFGVYSDVQFVDAWSWWTLQALSRFSEILACVLIFTLSAKRARIKDAVLMVTDDKDRESIYSTLEENSSESKKGILGKCFKRKKKPSKAAEERKISLFTALREIALMQAATAHDWHGTNLQPQMNAGGECWIETKTTCSIVHLPAESTDYHLSGNKCKQMKNGGQEQDREFLELGYARKQSMFTALHENKKINLTKFGVGQSAFNAGIVREEEDEKNENHLADDLSGCSSITLPNETIVYGENTV